MLGDDWLIGRSPTSWFASFGMEHYLHTRHLLVRDRSSAGRGSDVRELGQSRPLHSILKVRRSAAAPCVPFQAPEPGAGPENDSALTAAVRIYRVDKSGFWKNLWPNPVLPALSSGFFWNSVLRSGWTWLIVSV